MPDADVVKVERVGWYLCAELCIPEDSFQKKSGGSIHSHSLIDSIMAVRGIRGATSVTLDNSELIVAATKELLQELLHANQIETFEEIVSAIFTTSPDLTATFPAEAARSIGMRQVPLLCASEIAVPGSLPRCIRVLLHVNTEQKQSEITHVYLHEAKKLRPDMSSAQ